MMKKSPKGAYVALGRITHGDKPTKVGEPVDVVEIEDGERFDADDEVAEKLVAVKGAEKLKKSKADQEPDDADQKAGKK